MTNNMHTKTLVRLKEEELDRLPEWARKIVWNSERTRMSAYFYRMNAVAYRLATEEVLIGTGDDKTIALLDKIEKVAQDNMYELLGSDKDEEEKVLKSLTNEIKRRMKKAKNEMLGV